MVTITWMNNCFAVLPYSDKNVNKKRILNKRTVRFSLRMLPTFFEQYTILVKSEYPNFLCSLLVEKN